MSQEQEIVQESPDDIVELISEDAPDAEESADEAESEAVEEE